VRDDDEHGRRRGPRGGVTVIGHGAADAVPDAADAADPAGTDGAS